jgi:hypothetical protein
MVAVTNPALEQLVAQIGDELVLAQVLITHKGQGYELRHASDRSVGEEKLRAMELADLRSLAQFTARGAFRPLKSAPNLQTGWRVFVASAVELESALRHLYPGAVADWFTARAQSPPVTHFRDFTNRQTGMYRITTLLNDEQAAQVIRAGCHKQFCLKRRLWTINGLAADSAAEKSLIPCLEPCAVLLEFARMAMRIEQGERPLDLSPADAATIASALEVFLDQSATTGREADFSSPVNPRRIQRILEKLKPWLDAKSEM